MAIVSVSRRMFHQSGDMFNQMFLCGIVPVLTLFFRSQFLTLRLDGNRWGRDKAAMKTSFAICGICIIG
ncbi:hypothetical protein QBK99_09570 [Corticibacterium sp. UT-5YL-CI-8]|nr:hypothetical protein [Tianweitania sp. UT-5YL-CI-8]